MFCPSGRLKIFSALLIVISAAFLSGPTLEAGEKYSSARSSGHRLAKRLSAQHDKRGKSAPAKRMAHAGSPDKARPQASLAGLKSGSRSMRQIHFGPGPGDQAMIHFGPGPSNKVAIHFGPGPSGNATAKNVLPYVIR